MTRLKKFILSINHRDIFISAEAIFIKFSNFSKFSRESLKKMKKCLKICQFKFSIEYHVNSWILVNRSFSYEIEFRREHNNKFENFSSILRNVSFNMFIDMVTKSTLLHCKVQNLCIYYVHYFFWKTNLVGTHLVSTLLQILQMKLIYGDGLFMIWSRYYLEFFW